VEICHNCTSVVGFAFFFLSFPHFPCPPLSLSLFSLSFLYLFCWRNVTYSLIPSLQELQRSPSPRPTSRSRLRSLRERLGPTEYAQSLIEIQAAYINTKHPAFISGSAAANNDDSLTPRSICHGYTGYEGGYGSTSTGYAIITNVTG
jgi:hypothetical protein